jgi:hypothetical protein
MNSHIFNHIDSEKTKEVMRSIEFFLAITLVASVVGFACLSVA